jgi:hypothetical protein
MSSKIIYLTKFSASKYCETKAVGYMAPVLQEAYDCTALDYSKLTFLIRKIFIDEDTVPSALFSWQNENLFNFIDSDSEHDLDEDSNSVASEDALIESHD